MRGRIRDAAKAARGHRARAAALGGVTCVAVAICLGACGLVAGVGDFRDAPGAAASTGASGGGTTGTGGGGQGGAGGAPPAGSTLFVSPSGSDGASGLSMDAPKRTIAAALAAAKDVPDVTAIRICEGEYPEGDLRLEQNVSLLGGYACADFERPADFAFPGFGGVKSTVIRGIPGKATVVVAAPLPSTVAIEGLTIEAKADSGAALLLQAETSIVIRNNRLLGAASNTVDSFAVDVLGGSPEIAQNEIDGGGGTKSTGGIFVTGGGILSIHGNLIRGGAGTCAGPCFGSIGVQLYFASAGTTVSDNDIDGGSGSATAGGWASEGLLVGPDGSSSALVEHNTVHGGSNCAAGCFGVRVWEAGEVTVRGNRIVGGLGKGSAYGLAAYRQTNPLVVVNNMIHGVRSDDDNTAGTGVDILECTGIVIELNTITAGVHAGQFGGIALNAATATGTRVNGNLVFGAGDFLKAPDCPETGSFASFRANASLFGVSAFVGHVGCAGGAVNVTNMDQLEQLLQQDAGAAIADNAVFKSDCLMDTRCVLTSACTSSQACAEAFLDALSADGGYTTLLSDGWKQSSQASCTIAKSSVLDDMFMPPLASDQDFFGMQRTAQWSIGAHENDGACVSP